jgi:F420-non-reducing hydrogenase iron-sulfur subunit
VSMLKAFEPKIVGFLCNFCSYEAADSAGRARSVYPANLMIIRVPCSGRAEPEFVTEAFAEGADGVLILACHPGDCHFKEGNYRGYARYAFLKRMLPQFGIRAERLHLAWVSATEGEKFVQVVSEMVETVRRLGPLKKAQI